MLCAIAGAGCATTIYNLKIPLGDDRAPAAAESTRITIDDARRARDRRPHLADDIASCERWFGDDTLQPSKLAYLKRRLAERIASPAQIHLQLTHFDIIEYCEHSSSGNATGAARAAGGSIPLFTPAPVVGDTVVLRLAGDINGMPFDLSRDFDYGTLYRFPDRPSSSVRYRELLRSRLDEIIDQLVDQFGRAQRGAH
jgi:hypothetical protein